MPVYADLGPLDYFGEEGASWRAVGWLGKGHPFRQGEVSPAFRERLESLLRAPWQPLRFCGVHRCDLCPAGQPPWSGNTNLWVPGEGCVYVAPGMIAHDIVTHRYVPPEEFLDAVLRCPEMHSAEYHRALVASGFRGRSTVVSST